MRLLLLLSIAPAASWKIPKPTDGVSSAHPGRGLSSAPEGDTVVDGRSVDMQNGVNVGTCNDLCAMELCNCDDRTGCNVRVCDDNCGAHLAHDNCTVEQGGTSCDGWQDSTCTGGYTSCDCDSGYLRPPMPPSLPSPPFSVDPSGRGTCSCACAGSDSCDCDDQLGCDECDDNCPNGSSGCSPEQGGTSCDSSCDGSTYDGCDCDSGCFGTISPSPPPVPAGPDDAYCNAQCGKSPTNLNGWCTCDDGAGSGCDCSSTAAMPAGSCVAQCSGDCDCDDGSSCDSCDDSCPSGSGCTPAQGGTSCDDSCDGEYTSCDCDGGYPVGSIQLGTGSVTYSVYMTPDCSGTPNATQVFDGTCKTINAGVAAYHGTSGYFLAYAVPSNSQTDIIYTFGDETATGCAGRLAIFSQAAAKRAGECEPSGSTRSVKWDFVAPSLPSLPPPSLPPAASGGAGATSPPPPVPATVSYTVYSSGVVADYTQSALDQIKENVASALAGVSTEDVTVTVTNAPAAGRRLTSGGGVIITITITTDASAAVAIENQLNPTTGSTTAVSVAQSIMANIPVLASTGSAPAVTSVTVTNYTPPSAPPLAPPSGASHDDDNTMIIIAAAGGGFAALVIIVIAIFMCKKKAKVPPANV